MKVNQKKKSIFYMIIFKDKNDMTWVETVFNYLTFKKYRESVNFYSALIFDKKDTKRAFKRAEIIVKHGFKNQIIDMTKEG